MINNRVFKATLFSCLFSLSSLSTAKTIEIQYPFVLVPSSMKEIALLHNEDGFHVQQGNETYFVEKCWVDPSLQNISSENLQEFLTTGYISVNQMDSGEFSLQAKSLIKGGGVWGATVGFWAGRALVWGTFGALVTVGTVVAVPFVGAAAAAGAAAAVTGYCAPVVEGVAQVAQLATGLAGGIATGPA